MFDELLWESSPSLLSKSILLSVSGQSEVDMDDCGLCSLVANGLISFDHASRRYL